MVSQRDRVGERLEAAPVLGEPRDRQRARDGAEGDDEVRVAQVDETVAGLHLDALPLGIVGHGAPEDEVGVGAHHAQGDDDVPRLEGARRRLGKHGRVEHEVLGADDRRSMRAEQAGDVRPGEAAAEHERSAAGVPVGH